MPSAGQGAAVRRLKAGWIGTPVASMLPVGANIFQYAIGKRERQACLSRTSGAIGSDPGRMGGKRADATCRACASCTLTGGSGGNRSPGLRRQNQMPGLLEAKQIIPLWTVYAEMITSERQAGVRTEAF